MKNMSDEIDVITNKKRNKVIHFAHKKNHNLSDINGKFIINLRIVQYFLIKIDLKEGD